MLRELVLLAGFSLLVMASQMVWVTFSPVTSDVALEFGVTEWHIGFLATLFPLLYVIIAIPSGRILDTRFRLALLIGATLIGFGGAARVVWHDDYQWILLCQVVAAIGQPFVINAIAPYASRYFVERYRPLVVGVSSAFMYLGIIVGMALGEVLYNKGGLRLLEIPPAVVSAVSALWVMMIALLIKVEDPERRETHRSLHTLTTLAALRKLSTRRDLWLLSLLLGMGLGIFDILVSWLEPVLSEMGFEGLAGELLALMIAMGVIGAAILPSVASRLNARTYMMRVIALTAIITYILVQFAGEAKVLMVLFAIHGFLLLSGFPLIVEWIEATLPVSLQGQATGFVMLVSHILAVITLYPAGSLMGSPGLFFSFLSGLGVIAFTGTMMLPKR